MDVNIRNNEKDYRLTVVTVFRKLFGYSIFLMLIYCLFAYRDELNMVNLSRILSYFDTDVSITEDFKGYTFEVGIDSVYSPFNGGLALLNRDSLKLINAAGKEDLSVQLKYSNPQLITVDSRILAYDKGGKGLSLCGKYALLKKITTESEILWCSMNKNGDFLVLFDELGYKGSVQVFSSDIKEQFKWSSSEYYILSGCINTKGSGFSLLCLGGKEKSKSIIRTYSLSKEQPIYELEVSDKIVYSMEYDNNNNLVLICDTGVYTYDDSGKQIGVYSYGTSSLKTFSHKNAQAPALALTSGSDKTAVTVINKDSRAAEFKCENDISSIYYDGEIISALTNDKVHIYDMNTKELSTYNAFGAKGISKRNDGSYLAIFSDRAEILTK